MKLSIVTIAFESDSGWKTVTKGNSAVKYGRLEGAEIKYDGRKFYNPY